MRHDTDIESPEQAARAAWLGALDHMAELARMIADRVAAGEEPIQQHVWSYRVAVQAEKALGEAYDKFLNRRPKGAGDA